MNVTVSIFMCIGKLKARSYVCLILRFFSSCWFCE